MTIALSAGLSLKPAHYADALASPADARWFEVHPENYFVDGGPRLAWLDAVRARHPLSLHGVSLSLASDAPPDEARLARLVGLAARVEPALVSEHLAWSSWRGAYLPDLLPFPRTREALDRIAANVAIVQDALKRTIAIENPSHYLTLEGHELGEIAFLAELVRRTGCRLLVDVNNVYVSARNLGLDAESIIDAFPAEAIAEIHLAGHSADPVLGDALLVDTHDAQIAPAVWALYERLVARIGPRPTLVERDDKLPAYAELDAERARAAAVLAEAVAHPAEAFA
jgi:uncharacterized protein (UPF0276 family)